MDTLQTHERLVLRSIESLQLEMEKIKKPSLTEPIAVIGIDCRFLGGSNSPEAFWQMLAERTDAVREMPPDQPYGIDQLYHPDVNTPGKSVCRWGSFLDHIDQFDATHYGILPREAMFMDPQQRTYPPRSNVGGVGARRHSARKAIRKLNRCLYGLTQLGL